MFQVNLYLLLCDFLKYINFFQHKYDFKCKNKQPVNSQIKLT
jgi:hypothetical protein